MQRYIISYYIRPFYLIFFVFISFSLRLLLLSIYELIYYICFESAYILPAEGYKWTLFHSWLPDHCHIIFQSDFWILIIFIHSYEVGSYLINLLKTYESERYIIQIPHWFIFVQNYRNQLYCPVINIR